MSSRQLKKLQNQLRAATQDEDEEDDAEVFPSTMLKPSSNKKKKKNPPPTQQQEEEEEASPSSRPPPPSQEVGATVDEEKSPVETPTSAATAATTTRKDSTLVAPAATAANSKNASPKENKGNNKSKGSKTTPMTAASSSSKKNSSSSSPLAPAASTKNTSSAAQSKGNSSNSKGKHLPVDDDDEFEAVLAAYAKHQASGTTANSTTPVVGDSSTGGNAAEHAQQPSSDTSAILSPVGLPNTTSGQPAQLQQDKLQIIGLEELLVCDPRSLDPRTERIRSFGVRSVENLKPLNPALCPKFKVSPFVTPNPNKWPPFVPCGLRIVSTSSSGIATSSSSPTVSSASPSATQYKVILEKDYFDAQKRLLSAMNDPTQNIHNLIAVWRKQPYHIPTLLQLHNTFSLMQDQPEATQMLELAIYAAGNAMGAVPLHKSSAERQLLLKPVSSSSPSSSSSSQKDKDKKPGSKTAAASTSREEDEDHTAGATLVMEVLRLAVHAAMRKGCARTAVEVMKLLLSLDPSDPMHIYLWLDHVALRASTWTWFVQVFDALWLQKSKLLALPSLHYSAALAAFLVEQKEARASSNSSDTAASTTSTNSNRTGPTAMERAISAVRLFPGVSISIAEALKEKLGEKPWQDLGPALLAAAPARSATQAAGLEHVTSIYSKKSADLWKLPGAMEFLKQAIRKVVATDAGAEQQMAAARRTYFLQQGALEHYSQASVDHVMGTNNAAVIPRELLEQQQQMQAAAAAGGGNQQQQWMEMFQNMAAVEQQQGPPGRNELAELESVFGPLPEDIPATQRHAIYHEMLEQELRRVGEETNPFMLFLRTLMPGSTVRDLALQRRRDELRNEVGTDNHNPAASTAGPNVSVAGQEENEEEVFVTYDDDDDDDLN